MPLKNDYYTLCQYESRLTPFSGRVNDMWVYRTYYLNDILYDITC